MPSPTFQPATLGPTRHIHLRGACTIPRSLWIRIFCGDLPFNVSRVFVVMDAAMHVLAMSHPVAPILATYSARCQQRIFTISFVAPCNARQTVATTGCRHFARRRAAGPSHRGPMVRSVPGTGHAPPFHRAGLLAVSSWSRATRDHGHQHGECPRCEGDGAQASTEEGGGLLSHEHHYACFEEEPREATKTRSGRTRKRPAAMVKTL